MNIHSDESDLDNEIEEQIKKKLLSHSSPLEKLSRLESLEVGIKLYKYVQPSKWCLSILSSNRILSKILSVYQHAFLISNQW